MNASAIVYPKFRNSWLLLPVLLFLAGCVSPKVVDLPPMNPVTEHAYEESGAYDPTLWAKPPKKPPVAPSELRVPYAWTRRVITESEINHLSARDPDLTPVVALEILARLNVRARYYIDEDIKAKRPIRVPLNFSSFKNWTPLPRRLPELTNTPKFILLVKGIPFLGWYEFGWLLGDAQTCIGKEGRWTKVGFYRVKQKDADHISGSYTNAYGEPAPMPNALRIYDRVWIHTGDITGGYCSHGCINLPLQQSRELFEWAEVGTPVLIVDAFDDMSQTLKSDGFKKSVSAEEPPPKPPVRKKRDVMPAKVEP